MDVEQSNFIPKRYLFKIVVSPLNVRDQIDPKKYKNVSRQTYSFLKVKLRQSDWKSW